MPPVNRSGQRVCGDWSGSLPAVFRQRLIVARCGRRAVQYRDDVTSLRCDASGVSQFSGRAENFSPEQPMPDLTSNPPSPVRRACCSLCPGLPHPPGRTGPAERAFSPSRLGLLLREARRQLQDHKSRDERDLPRAPLEAAGSQLLVCQGLPARPGGQITVYEGTATIRGRNAKLLQMASGAKIRKGTDQVPSFMSEWRARRDSNSRPSGSKPDALSS